jgi:hypothetical protein
MTTPRERLHTLRTHLAGAGDGAGAGAGTSDGMHGVPMAAASLPKLLPEYDCTSVADRDDCVTILECCSRGVRSP